MFETGCPHALTHGFHLWREGAWHFPIAERKAEVAGSHFGKAKTRHAEDLFDMGDGCGRFDLHAQEQFAFGVERPRLGFLRR